ncbi:hypothetical protein ACSBM8_12345 [Sphingomonas sp. ASY06-1R]|uniref:hypothetical protein n=1 Tax=Sphingomonas sp. ASY06-1R TaxID=3445771 RepID=UPI003FA2326A
MGVVENIKDWLANEASPEERAAIEERLNPEGGLLAAINGVPITGPQMRAAIGAITHIQVRTPADALEHARILRQFASERGFTPPEYAGPALHARAVAMDRWCRLHDRHGQTDVDAFFEAAATHPLRQTDQGMAFDPEAFADHIRILAEMPF